MRQWQAYGLLRLNPQDFVDLLVTFVQGPVQKVGDLNSAEKHDPLKCRWEDSEHATEVFIR